MFKISLACCETNFLPKRVVIPSIYARYDNLEVTSGTDGANGVSFVSQTPGVARPVISAAHMSQQ